MHTDVGDGDADARRLDDVDVWMRIPDQTWPGASASFLVMWAVMMVAMMLPSLVPMLRRHRQAVGRTGATRLGQLTAIVAAGYFFVWTVFGMAVFPLGVTLAAVGMQQPALARTVPIAVGVVVLIAGALQFSAWKARHLACCRVAPGGGMPLIFLAGVLDKPVGYPYTASNQVGDLDAVISNWSSESHPRRARWHAPSRMKRLAARFWRAQGSFIWRRSSSRSFLAR